MQYTVVFARKPIKFVVHCTTVIMRILLKSQIPCLEITCQDGLGFMLKVCSLIFEFFLVMKTWISYQNSLGILKHFYCCHRSRNTRCKINTEKIVRFEEKIYRSFSIHTGHSRDGLVSGDLTSIGVHLTRVICHVNGFGYSQCTTVTYKAEDRKENLTDDT